MKYLILLVFLLVACTQEKGFVDFNKSDFPIYVSCEKEQDGCYFLEGFSLAAIQAHNDLLGFDVLEWSDEKGSGDIQVLTTSYLKNDDGSFNYSADAQTNYGSDPITISLVSNLFFGHSEDEQTCIFMHELGHALGYHGHNEEDGTLMSESADCETEGWYDDFYNWFQEMYQ